MQLVRQPSRWSCLATSWAMVLECTPQEIFEALGHDGSEILYPEAPEPLKRKAFHPAEFDIFALGRGYAIVPIEKDPQWESPSGAAEPLLKEEDEKQRRLNFWMHNFRGVITGTTPTGLSHAVAWTRKVILDPAFAYRFRDYMNIHTFWAAVPRRIV